MNKLVGISIDQYNNPLIKTLNNCLTDLQSIIASLTAKFKFDEIDLLAKAEQTTKSSVYNALYELLINSLEEDNILILFAGHGEYNPVIGSSYWLLYDSQRKDITTWFNLNDLLQLFKFAPAKHIALISDSCFSGGIFENTRGGGFQAFEGKKSRYALTSGSIEKVKDGLPNTASPFAMTLVNLINSYDGEKLTFTELCEKTIIAFSEKMTQTPNYGALNNCGHEGGVFVLQPIEQNVRFQDLKLSVEISRQINIDYDFKIPFLKKDRSYDSEFINSFIAQKGYWIINEVR